jgi:hypothetical protein
MYCATANGFCFTSKFGPAGGGHKGWFTESESIAQLVSPNQQLSLLLNLELMGFDLLIQFRRFSQQQLVHTYLPTYPPTFPRTTNYMGEGGLTFLCNRLTWYNPDLASKNLLELCSSSAYRFCMCHSMLPNECKQGGRSMSSCI